MRHECTKREPLSQLYLSHVVIAVRATLRRSVNHITYRPPSFVRSYSTEVQPMKLVIYPPVDAVRETRIREAAAPMSVINANDNVEALREIVEAEAFFGKLTPKLLAHARRLRWVQSPTASLEHFLFPALVEHPCLLSNMRGLFSDVIADHVLGYVLCFARNLHVYLRQQQRGEWSSNCIYLIRQPH